jgi:hypothetical protein
MSRPAALRRLSWEDSPPTSVDVRRCPYPLSLTLSPARRTGITPANSGLRTAVVRHTHIEWWAP